MDKCVCVLIKPGSKILPVASITLSTFSSEILSEISEIKSFLINKSFFSS